MQPVQRLIIIAVVLTAGSDAAFAQAARLNLAVPAEQLVAPAAQRSVSAAMHPVGKGALIGGLAGAAFVGAVGLWYCTIGPNEVGECENPRWIWKGLAIYGPAGAGIGALIGAIVDRR